MMKKSTRIFVLAISFALLVGAMVGFSATAEESAPEIVSKNIMVDGNYSLMFAVDPATVSGDDVTLNVYAEAPAEGVEAVQTLTKAKAATEKIDLDGDGTAEYDAIVFETSGVSAKDIADVWYITATSGGVTSEAITYSVREYAFERLYKNGTIFATEDDADLKKYYQKQFYLEILDVGSAAQQLLVNRPLISKGEAPEMLAKDYTYISVIGGTYTLGEVTESRGFVDKNAAVTLTADNAATTTWRIFSYNEEGVSLSTVAIDVGETLTVTGNTVIMPYTKGVTPGLYFEEIGNSVYKMDGLTYKNLQYNQGTTHTAYLGHSGFAAGATISKYNFMADCGDEHGAVFSVSKPENATATCQGSVHFPVAEGDEDANCLVFEFDVKFNGDVKHRFGTDPENPPKVDSRGELSTSVFYLGFFSNTLAECNSWGNMKNNSQFSTSWISKDYDGVVDENLNGGDAFRIEGVPNSNESFDILPDKWYNICYEIYPVENKCVIYVDGVRAGEWGPSSYTIASGDVNNINLVTLMMDGRLYEFDMWLDNVFAGKVVKEYVAP